MARPNRGLHGRPALLVYVVASDITIRFMIRR